MRRFIACSFGAAVALIATGASAQTASPVIPYSLATASYSQDFDTLALTGTSNVLPTGFQIAESGTGAAADGFYAAGTGSSNAGNAYSFGASGSAERALGSLTSGSVTPIQFGRLFTNGLAAVITDLAIGYTGEQWRVGNAAASLLTFEYSTNATSLTTGNWTRASALDFLPLFINGTSTGAALDGNLAANQRAISGTLSGLSIGIGSGFGLRWTQADVTGADQGLGIDNLSLRATSAQVQAAVPEPSTWAMMLFGFGAIGWSVRSRRRRAAAAA